MAAGPHAGLDVFSDLTNGKTTSVCGFATLGPAGVDSTTCSSVTLLTGAANPPPRRAPTSPAHVEGFVAAEEAR